MAAENYGAWLRSILNSAAFQGSQSALAGALGLTQGYVSKVVRGEENDPSLSTLDDIARRLGRSSTWKLIQEIERFDRSTAPEIVPEEKGDLEGRD